MNHHFDFIAPFYDRAIPFSRLEKMVEVLALPCEGRLLDAGGGTGRVASVLQPYLTEVVVADVSPGMLNQARAKGLDALNAQTERLPFADNFFERILMVDALHHVIHQAETLGELYRILQPGGRLVVEEPDIRTFPVKLIAIAEKLALMRSHFLSPSEIAAFFPDQAQVKIEIQDYNAWVIVQKPGVLG
ncbi:MAG: methyltransferase type 11 [Chloroflexi bacterium HGW-Chloroflexi-6]|nr:MAG: methyltransferase type 11 [Chloroflexi bacterium HGW-Chloroflexi-6]